VLHDRTTAATRTSRVSLLRLPQELAHDFTDVERVVRLNRNLLEARSLVHMLLYMATIGQSLLLNVIVRLLIIDF